MEIRSTFKLYDCTIIYFDLFNIMYVCDKHQYKAYMSYDNIDFMKVEQLYHKTYNDLYLIYHKCNGKTIKWLKFLTKVHHKM